MTKHFLYSKILHLMVLISFLFPFFFNGCSGIGKEEMERREKAIADSVALVYSLNDTLNFSNDSEATLNEAKEENSINQIVNTTNTIDEAQMDDSKNNDKKNFLSEEASTRFPFLKMILIPEEHTYTGLALVIDGVGYFQFLGVFLAFILLVIGFIVKCIEQDARRTIVLLIVLSLVCLAFSIPPIFEYQTLWGYWVCCILTTLLTLYDLYIAKRCFLFRGKST